MLSNLKGIEKVANMYKRIFLSLAAISVLSQASAVTIESSEVEVINFTDSFRVEVNKSLTGYSIPTSKSADATSESGDYYSRIQIDFTGYGDQVTLSYTIDQKRDGPHYDDAGEPGDWGYSIGWGFVAFRVDSNTTYELSGFYDVEDVNAAGYTYFQCYLDDFDGGGPSLFNSEQLSGATADERFDLGSRDGDDKSILSGSLSGTLLAHSEHWFYFKASTDGADLEDKGASAVGEVVLKIGGGAPGNDSVPDGGVTAALLGLALIGMATARRRLAG